MNLQARGSTGTYSDLIKEGSPSVYKLTTKVENIGTLRRVTFGKKDPKKTNKTILLVGERGAGKSTLINALFNYTMGVKFEDDVWFKFVEEEERSQSESQTSDVIVYHIFGFEGQTLPYSLTIIDTPGYGNTTKPEQDLIVSHRLFDLFRSDDGVHQVDVVGLVMKASMNRVNERLKYIFDSVMSLFGKDLEKNIVALLTHSDGMRPDDALEALKVAEIKSKTKNPAKHADETSMTGMKELQTFTENNKPQKLEKTVEVLNERVRLTACIQNLQERIKLIELKQTEIKQTEEALKKHQQAMKMNENFIIETDEVYKDKKTIDGGMWGLFFFAAAVCCLHCEENCHYPGCTMAWYPDNCEVMKDGRCIVCTSKCLASAHVKEKWKYVNKKRRVQKTLKDVKKKYEKSKTESKQAESLLETLYKEKEKLEADKAKWLEESYQHVVRLEQIALNVHSVSTHVHLDFLTEKMEKHDKEKYKKLKEMAQRLNDVTRSRMKYAMDKLWTRIRGNPQDPTGTGV
uniref:Septin-type G domain-containing protein n=1 Tax=Kryptolebias marmoratus TaxID=37003 RepID=A0A3Q2ZIY3_KRYMA